MATSKIWRLLIISNIYCTGKNQNMQSIWSILCACIFWIYCNMSTLEGKLWMLNVQSLLTISRFYCGSIIQDVGQDFCKQLLSKRNTPILKTMVSLNLRFPKFVILYSFYMCLWRYSPYLICHFQYDRFLHGNRLI